MNGQNRKDIKPGLRVHITQSQMLGQVLTAAQARNTYGPIDLDIFMSFAHVAAAVYMAHGGPEWLRTLRMIIPRAVRNPHPAARSVRTVISGGTPRRMGSANVPSPGLTYRKAYA